jgi:hypothetical protein
MVLVIHFFILFWVDETSGGDVTLAGCGICTTSNYFTWIFFLSTSVAVSVSVSVPTVATALIVRSLLLLLLSSGLVQDQ